MSSPSFLGLLRRTGALAGPANSPNLSPGRLTLSPEGALAVSSHLLLLAADHMLTHVGSAADGGIPIVAQTVMLSAARQGTHPLLKGYYHRREVKDHGTMNLTEGHAPGPDDRVALVTDLTTSGNALLEAIANTTARGAQVAFAFTVIEHGTAARRALERRRHLLLSLHQVP